MHLKMMATSISTDIVNLSVSFSMDWASLYKFEKYKKMGFMIWGF